MARLFADENFPIPAVQHLRILGHDVLTIHEAGQGDQSTSDHNMLAFATSRNMAVLTMNRRHFIQLHAEFPDHAGIIICTFDPDFAGQARRINDLIREEPALSNKLIRVNRSQK